MPGSGLPYEYMNALVVNCSKQYNLGAEKLANWLEADGHKVTRWKADPGLFAEGYDLVALSVIFSWDAPIALQIAQRVKQRSDVWCGGPGMAALGKWWTKETGLTAHYGLDPRFEQQQGHYKMTFASRGCPVNCWFCIVPKIEGQSFTLYWEFQPAPILCDNNLSALPLDFQSHIVTEYVKQDMPLRDANSGFEPRTYTDETYNVWKPVLKGPWRFALDEIKELEDVRRMMALLAHESPKRKRVYVLIGNEPFEQCYERAQKVIEWGGEPFCQPIIALNALVKKPMLRHGWTERQLTDFARYYNRFIWRYADYKDYDRSIRTNR